MHNTTAPPIERVTVLVDASRADFFHPPLDTYHPVHYISPRITENLAGQLARHSVILCAGDAPADLLNLARHVAWFVTVPPAPKLGVLRKVTSVQRGAAAAAGKQRIHQALLTYEEPTLFILPRLLPKHIDYDFSLLLDVAQRRGHVVLATTDMPLIWQNQMPFDMLKHHWQTLRTDAIYDAEVLAKEFVRAVIVAKQRLPRDFVTSVARTNKVIGSISAAQVAVNLRTPSQIGEFVELLCGASETEEITGELIHRLQVQVTNDGRRLRAWFLNLADTREQLLALAMTLFDGLAGDQFFAVFDMLVERTWGRRAPSLRGVDYADTDSVHQYVRLVKTDHGEVINAQLLNQRSLLIKQSWEQYRRHILSTLPILVQLVRSSIELDTSEPALSGSNERRDNLRIVISNVLGDIGLVDHRVVEESLLQLALDPHVAIQSVAARAIARWRDRDNNQQMVEFLSRLQRHDVAFDASVRGIVEAQSERYNAYGQARQNLHKTVLLTIGYAAQFERPDFIPKSLFDELEHAARGDDTDLLRFFCTYVLPLLLNKHLNQVSRLIPRLARNRTLHDVIAQGLAQVYGSNAETIDELLLRWYEHTVLNRDSSMSEARFRTRADLLSCVLTCYGYLPYDTKQHHPVLNRIQQVIQDEEDELVRISAINTLFRLLGDNVDPARGLLGLLQHKRSHQTNEIDLAVDRLVDIGKRQREEQKGGDQFKVVGDDRRQVALWVGQVRPLTNLERTLLDWVQDRRHIVAQQVAVRVLVTIVTHYRSDEMHRQQLALRKRIQRRRTFSQALRERIERSIGGLHAFSFYNYLIVPPGVALTSPRHMAIVRNVLPELVDISFYNKFPVAWFYDRLEEIDQGDGDLHTLALRLEQAVRWSRFQAFVKIVLGVMLLCIIIILVWRFVAARR